MRSGKNYLQNYVSWKNLNFDHIEKNRQIVIICLSFAEFICQQNLLRNAIRVWPVRN